MEATDQEREPHFTRYIVSDEVTQSSFKFSNKKDAISKQKEIISARKYAQNSPEYRPNIFTVDDWLKMKGL